MPVRSPLKPFGITGPTSAATMPPSADEYPYGRRPGARWSDGRPGSARPPRRAWVMGEVGLDLDRPVAGLPGPVGWDVVVADPAASTIGDGVGCSTSERGVAEQFVPGVGRGLVRVVLRGGVSRA